MIACPNEGCDVQRHKATMNVHRDECEHEEVTCPCPGCDARLLRKSMDAHVEATHLQMAAKELQRLWQEDSKRKAALESEQRHAAAAPTWVFNWVADGWDAGVFRSETHDFGDGVTGRCVFQPASNPELSHCIGYGIEGRDKFKAHVTLSILDKHDKTLREVYRDGTATAPSQVVFLPQCDSRFRGRNFTPTAEEKAQSVRPLSLSLSLSLSLCVHPFLSLASSLPLSLPPFLALSLPLSAKLSLNLNP
jgi:hypothetical protein